MGLRGLEVRRVRVDSIEIPEWHGRELCDESEIEALAESIEKHGQIQPIVVRPIKGGKYELVSGWRRLQAAGMLGSAEIESVVKECSDEEALALALEENLERRNEHPFDTARKIAYWHRVKKSSISSIAEKMGRSASWVKKMLSIDGLAPSAKKLLAEKEKDYNIIYEVSRFRNPVIQAVLADFIAEKQLSRDKVLEMVKQIPEDSEPSSPEEARRIVEEAARDIGMVRMRTIPSEPKNSRYEEKMPEKRICEICGEEFGSREGRSFSICSRHVGLMAPFLAVVKTHGIKPGAKILERLGEIGGIIRVLGKDEAEAVLGELLRDAEKMKGRVLKSRETMAGGVGGAGLEEWEEASEG